MLWAACGGENPLWGIEVRGGPELAEDPAGAGESWRLVRLWTRLALALVLLAEHGITYGWRAWVSWSLEGGFALFAAVALLWRYRSPASGALLELCLDTIFFLSISHFSLDHGSWLDAGFCLYVMMAAAVFHGWRETCLVAAVSVSVFVAAPPLHDEGLGMVSVTGALACVLAYRRNRIERLLERRSAETDQLRLRLGTVVEAERQRLAGDFHDGPLQQFIGLQMRLEVLRRTLERDAAAGKKELADLQETAKSQVRELRAFLKALRPTQVSRDGLESALQQTVGEFRKDSGIDAVLHGEGFGPHDLTERTTELLQIIREALHNVQKHSRASRVAVHAARASNGFEISIEDDGAGFPFSGGYSLTELEALGIGPGSIKRRVRNLGGDLTLESHPGRGAALRIRIPA
jgi:signal transduction histidine kinase